METVFPNGCSLQHMIWMRTAFFPCLLLLAVYALMEIEQKTEVLRLKWKLHRFGCVKTSAFVLHPYLKKMFKARTRLRASVCVSTHTYMCLDCVISLFFPKPSPLYYFKRFRVVKCHSNLSPTTLKKKLLGRGNAHMFDQSRVHVLCVCAHTL